MSVMFLVLEKDLKRTNVQLMVYMNLRYTKNGLEIDSCMVKVFQNSFFIVDSQKKSSSTNFLLEPFKQKL